MYSNFFLPSFLPFFFFFPFYLSLNPSFLPSFLPFFRLFIFYLHPRTCLLILEKGEGREGGREKHHCERETLPLTRALTRDQTHNPDMCPDQESNQRTFSLRDNAPANWTTPARAPIPYCNDKGD